MLKRLLKSLIPVVLLTTMSSTYATESKQWLTSMDDAKRIAREENKDILMFFTGSDWCVWCNKLEEEVFLKEEFLKFAKPRLVLVQLDLPMGDDIISEEQRTHNEKWKGQLNPKAFPSVYLTTPDAEPYSLTGYQPGGAIGYIEHLKQLLPQKARISTLLKEVDNASKEPLKQAKILDQVLSMENAYLKDRSQLINKLLELSSGLDDNLYKKYLGIRGDGDLMSELEKVDQTLEAKDQLKILKQLSKKYSLLKEGMAATYLFNELGYNFKQANAPEEGIEFFDRKLEDQSYPDEFRQSFLLWKALLVAQTGDLESGKELLNQAITMAPNSDAAKSKDRLIAQLEGVASQTQDANKNH